MVSMNNDEEVGTVSTAESNSSRSTNARKQEEYDDVENDESSLPSTKKEVEENSSNVENNRQRLLSSRVVVVVLLVLVGVVVGIVLGVGVTGHEKNKLPNLDSLDENGSLTPCAEDPDCGIIMVGIGPVIPPGFDDVQSPNYDNYNKDICSESQLPACDHVMESLAPVISPHTKFLFTIPGTCQSRSWEWLLIQNDDIFNYDAKRIRQRYALAMLYCELDGDHWLIHNQWLSATHECLWWQKQPWQNDEGEDVTTIYTNDDDIGICDENEEIQILRLNRNGLAGTLPPEVSILSSSLRELTLSENLISGTIPPEYSKLSRLEIFDISHNIFEGPIPGLLFRYPNLRTLDISLNRFTGSMPTTIGNRMPNLEKLFIHNNQIGGSIPSTIGNLPDLQVFYADDNALTGPIPETLFSASNNLKQLYLHSNQLEGTVTSLLDSNSSSGSSGSGNDSTTVSPGIERLTLHYNPSLSGSINDEVCENNDNLEFISIDCPKIACACCTCGVPENL